MFAGSETCIKSGAVYAYRDRELATILKKHANLLTSHHWPTSVGDFIKKIASEWFDENYPVMPVIRAAFGETP